VGRHAFAARLLAEDSQARSGGRRLGVDPAENYGHLERSHIDDAMRETGAITKLGSSVPMLPAPETVGHVLGTNVENDVLLDAIRGDIR
jgi:hypothetical protein